VQPFEIPGVFGRLGAQGCYLNRVPGFGRGAASRPLGRVPREQQDFSFRVPLRRWPGGVVREHEVVGGVDVAASGDRPPIRGELVAKIDKERMQPQVSRLAGYSGFNKIDKVLGRLSETHLARAFTGLHLTVIKVLISARRA
jgi:hypothetical protein